MTKKTLSLGIIISLIATLFVTSFAFGWGNYLGSIPVNNFSCLICHDSINGGSRNPFGVAFSSGHIYYGALETVDSDGDGATNAAEFAAGTNPGDPLRKPATGFTITASAGANGSITPSGSVAVNSGANQTFTIAANTGYHIASVLVDAVSAGTVGTYTFTNVTANHTISATFAINTFTIAASAGANGSITPSGSVVVNSGTNRAFTIAPNAGYHVANVLVDGTTVGAVTTYTFTNVTANHTISASFAINATVTYTITASAGANGSISPLGSVTVNSGANQTFTIAANAGYHIASVLVDTVSAGTVGTYTFTNVTANHTISATFAINATVTCTITASAGANGSISPSGSVVVNSGTNRAFTITPNAGYHIASVLVDTVSAGTVGTYTFTNVTANHTISATFAINTCTITASAGANGGITPSGSVTVNHGANRAFTTAANPGYHVASVLIDGTSIGAVSTYTFTNVTANHTISVSFAIDAPNTYTITASAGANGSITPSGSVTVNSGASQAFTITPSTGYHVVSVLVDGLSVGTLTTYTFTNVTANHTISASFAINTYTITASAGSGGTITPSGSVTVNYGANQTFTITANAGYHIADVLSDGSSLGAVGLVTFNGVGANHTISASFAINTTVTYTITALAGANGSITPSGTVTVNSGANQTFTITPNAGYKIEDVLVDGPDGGSVGAVSSYTFTSVTANHTISASFAINATVTYTITASAGANGSISPSGSVTVNSGANRTFTITPNEGAHVSNVSVDGSSIGIVDSYTFTNVTANHTISASFTTESSDDSEEDDSEEADSEEADSEHDGERDGKHHDNDHDKVSNNKRGDAPVNPNNQPNAKPAQNAPNKTKLMKNYPNPFNPETWIPFELAETANVKVQIYNMTGHLVRTLDLGTKTAGYYQDQSKAVHWDGKNEANEQVSSGIYFYTIHAGKFTAINKMIVKK